MIPEPIFLAAGSAANLWGRIAFAGIYLVVAASLALLPARFIGQEGARPPLWKNVRCWAIAIALVQLVVYAVLG
jgi:hypothetical protein